MTSHLINIVLLSLIPMSILGQSGLIDERLRIDSWEKKSNSDLKKAQKDAVSIQSAKLVVILDESMSAEDVKVIRSNFELHWKFNDFLFANIEEAEEYKNNENYYFFKYMNLKAEIEPGFEMGIVPGIAGGRTIYHGFAIVPNIKKGKNITSKKYFPQAFVQVSQSIYSPEVLGLVESNSKYSNAEQAYYAGAIEMFPHYLTKTSE